MTKFECHAKAMKNANGDMFARIPQNRKQEYNAVLAEFLAKYQGNCKITVSKISRKRSTGKNSQNSKLNGDCQLIATCLGDTFGNVKEYCKSQAVDMGYPMKMKEDGTPFLNCWGAVSGISESDATVEDAIILIKAIQQFADENGIKLKEGDNE
jgi:hypothetical protein